MNQKVIQSIVLADDDSDDHHFFKEALAEASPATALTIVKDGKELLDLLQHYLPDLLFLDLDMPVKNGLECLQEIRSNEKTKSIGVVVFSSTTRPANIETAYEMGADLFYIKPSNYNELLSSIKAIIHLDWSNPLTIKSQYYIEGKYTAFTQKSLLD
jgi:CheY-like chemotaxis protein